MKKLTILDLSLCAAACALHIVLELFCTIRIGNDLKITLAALPFLVIAFLCGPWEGLLTGLVGTFLSQLLTFGITITTPFWILPYAAQGLVAGLIFRAFQKKKGLISYWKNNPVSSFRGTGRGKDFFSWYLLPFGLSIFVSGFVAVIFNWIASYLDGVVFFKYWTLEVLLGITPVRILVWIIVSVIYTAICMPLVTALIKSTPAGRRTV